MNMVKISLNGIVGLARITREWDCFSKKAYDVTVLDRMELPNGYIISPGTQTWVFEYQIVEHLQTRH